MWRISPSMSWSEFAREESSGKMAGRGDRLGQHSVPEAKRPDMNPRSGAFLEFASDFASQRTRQPPRTASMLQGMLGSSQFWHQSKAIY